MTATTISLSPDTYMMDYPGSVEEAAALLGAAITRCCGVNGRNIHEATLPPMGMHPAFAVVSSGGGSESELLQRLYILRTMLRTAADTNEPLAAAPSILQVLKKLLGISTQVAAAAATPGTTSVLTSSSAGTSSAPSESTSATGGDTLRRTILLLHKFDTPPLWSTPCRILWVDCVVLCHALAVSTTASDLTNFVRQMLVLASIHPRSVKGSGGVRVAALSVLAALLRFEASPNFSAQNATTTKRNVSLATTLAPWSLDVLQVCLKALRSAGNGEPTFREAAIQTACAAASACRIAALKSRNSRVEETTNGGKEDFCLVGAMEDRAIAESLKILKQAATDKFPEIRSGAATFAISLAPILIPHGGSGTAGSTADPLASLEEVLQLSLKNLDDESLDVANGWAEALASGLCSLVQYHESIKAAVQNKSANSGGDGGDSVEVSSSNTPSQSPTAAVGRFGSKKATALSHTLTTSTKVINYLVEQFIKVGGELVAVKAGGPYSIGGRALRLGWSMALARFLRVQSAVSAIGEGRSISTQTAIISALEMAQETEEDDQTKATSTPRLSVSDAPLCRLFAVRVLRYGLMELASESFQLSLLQELVGLLPTTNNAESSSASPYPLKSNQTQVVLVEISNLITALGEAAEAKVDDLKACIDVCIAHSNIGIRFEAAMLCVTIVKILPSYGVTLINDSMEIIQQQLALVVEAIPTGHVNNKEKEEGRNIFRRPQNAGHGLKSLTDSVIHGRALLISMLIKAIPNHSSGMLRSTFTSVLHLAEMLVDSQFNEVLTASSPSSVCTLVRAGFAIVSGILSIGPDAVEPLMSQIVSAWKKAGLAAKQGGKSMSAVQDLLCIESAISSVTVFLMHCSELLLVIPEALSQVSMFLEEIFSLFKPSGRLGSPSNDPIVKTMMENATATLLEGFSWLPSGSFPLVADEVFLFAEDLIRKSVERGIKCSLLESLVSKQDNILDAKPHGRAGKEGKLGGLDEFEERSILISGNISLHSERQSVIYLQSYRPCQVIVERESAFCGSAILEHLANDSDVHKPPTPLHDVGTWRRPVDPSCSSSVRLIDAAIQAFSATFGLKDGKEQQGAIVMLESLLPQALTQFARVIGINGVSPEVEKRSKLKDESAAAVNITTVLLSCLQALPLHEATHNIPIGLGPPWMNKAKVLLLALLPSTCTNVRRASAEGLALLATLGVTEDAHFLQSALLHSLDEIMQSNKPDGKARTLPLDQVSAARSGSLLTLACIQRTASNVAKRKYARARGRLHGKIPDTHIDISDDNLPVLQMMTRILPSAACHGFKESFIVKTYALYSFMMLLMYTRRLTSAQLSDEDKQLLRKGIELVEDNFAASWTAASSDSDRGQENERLDCEIVFLAVMLRLMTFLFPFLRHVQGEDRDVGRRFSVLATVALETYWSHPSIFVEAMAFFEVSCANKQLLPKLSHSIRFTENAVVACLPTVVKQINPDRSITFGHNVSLSWQVTAFRNGLKAAVYLLKMLPLDNEFTSTWSSLTISSILASTLEVFYGSRCTDHVQQSISSTRQLPCDNTSLETQIFLSLIDLTLRNMETASVEERNKKLLRCIMFSRHLLSRFPSTTDLESNRKSVREKVVSIVVSQAIADGKKIYSITNAVRWQVKCLFVQLATEALALIAQHNDNKRMQFDFVAASESITHYAGRGSPVPNSAIVFHLEDLLSSACMSAVATTDHTELRCLQENSMYLIKWLVECFGSVLDPDEPSHSILHQYSTQIMSSVKNALAVRNAIGADVLSSIYVTGCDILQSIIRVGLINDEVVIKRLLSIIVAPEDSFPIFSFDDGFRTTFVHSGCAFVVRVCSIWTVGNILLSPRHMLKADFVQRITKDVVKDRLGMTAHLSGLSIDGCRILLSHNISLSGVLHDSTESSINDGGGFFYKCVDDLDDRSKTILSKTWAQNASSSIAIFIDELSHDLHRDTCLSWIASLIPLILSGIEAGLESLVNESQKSKLEWALELEPITILKDCMLCLGNILKSGRPEWSSEDFYDDINEIINQIYDSIFLVALHPSEKNVLYDTSVILQACELMSIYSQLNSFAPTRNPSFVCSLLEILHEVECDMIKSNNDWVETIIESCILSIGEVIRHLNGTNYSLVISMLQYSTKILMSHQTIDKGKRRDAAKVLFIVCLGDTSLKPTDCEKVLCQFASSDLWEEWATAVALNTGAVYSSTRSRQLLQKSLINPTNPKSHMAALTGIRCLLQNYGSSTTEMHNLVGNIFYDIGGEVVHLMFVYGTMKIQRNVDSDSESILLYRNSICTDSMKIILVAYRHLVAEDIEVNTTDFISIIFETFLSVIRFNGLPNHPSQEKVYGDVSLGRICAQAILYVARTTPVSFKNCVAALPTDHDRTLLEFAVRAEMNGYVVTAPIVEPTKKKLNLQGFKK